MITTWVSVSTGDAGRPGHRQADSGRPHRSHIRLFRPAPPEPVPSEDDDPMPSGRPAQPPSLPLWLLLLLLPPSTSSAISKLQSKQFPFFFEVFPRVTKRRTASGLKRPTSPKASRIQWRRVHVTGGAEEGHLKQREKKKKSGLCWRKMVQCTIATTAPDARHPPSLQPIANKVSLSVCFATVLPTPGTTARLSAIRRRCFFVRSVRTRSGMAAIFFFFVYPPIGSMIFVTHSPPPHPLPLSSSLFQQV